MKICFALMWGDGIGGTNRAIYSQAEALRSAHLVSVVSVLKTEDRPFYDLPEGVGIRYLVDATGQVPRAVRGGTDAHADAFLATQPSALVEATIEPGYSALTDRAIEHAFRDLDADVVVTASPPQLAMATRFAPAGTAIVHQEHRTSEARKEVTQQLLLTSAAWADAVVLLTRPTADWFRAALGDTAPRIEVIPNALTDVHRPRSLVDNPVILTAGRFVPAKQLAHAIDAFAAAAADVPGWSLRLFGEGPQQRYLQRRVNRAGLTDSVVLPGLTPYLEREWSKASIGVMTSRSEGFPLVIAEAMAAGVPFVSYDCPNGPAAMITHGKTGLLVPPGDTDGLAAALTSLMRDDGRRREMGEAAAAGAERFRSPAIAASWLELYAALASDLDARGPRRRR